MRAAVELVNARPLQQRQSSGHAIDSIAKECYLSTTKPFSFTNTQRDNGERRGNSAT